MLLLHGCRLTLLRCGAMDSRALPGIRACVQISLSISSASFWVSSGVFFKPLRGRLSDSLAGDPRVGDCGLVWLCYNYSTLEIVIILIINYGVKQNQFTKLI